jgi:hypothetical protein
LKKLLPAKDDIVLTSYYVVVSYDRPPLVLVLQSDGYTDERSDYVHNEVAVGYNTGLTAALAALVSLAQG